MANIFVIDDDGQVLKQLEVLIKSFGHVPLTTLYATYTFQFLKSESVDLILLDINMPEIDGIMLLRQLKEHPVFRKIPVIMLTGDTNNMLLKKCFENGAVDFINKPFDEVVLRARISSALAIQEYIQKLKESEENYRLVAETVSDAIVTIDEKNNILFANPATEQIFGHSLKQLIGKNITMLMPKSTRLKHSEALKQYLKTNKQIHSWKRIELIGLHKNGTEIFLESSFGEIIKNEQHLFTGTLRDVTGRKHAEKERERLEKQLHQSQKMEAIGILAGGIAHEFNNLLFAILGYAEMLREDLVADELMHDSVDQIFKAGGRAKDLVQQILTFSRRSESERKPVQIHPLVKEALKLMRATLPTTIEISQNIEVQEDRILADPTQIHQMIMNLCTNASQAMAEKGGTLTIELKKVMLDDEFALLHEIKGGAYLQLSISDTGTGMTEDIMEQVFDPFFTTKTIGKGTGMGLAVVHGTIKSHKGAIVVKSTPGEGSTFDVFLAAVEPNTNVEKPNTMPLLKGRENILLVDDEILLVNMLKQKLERLDYKVTAMTSSKKALELFLTQPDQFDLVITDQTMPQMTGGQLASELMAIRPDLPVILFTGFSESLSPGEAQAIGIREYIMKPIDIRALSHAIRHVLKQK
ncbi:MAG: response regulator [SAR324 cluster bacterium]|nr:response regulator [SAR324 cluster bacterium]